MMMSTALIQASYVGVRELRAQLFQRLKSDKTLIVTEHGTPTRVIVAYQDMVDLVEMLDEIQDAKTLKAVQNARKGLKRGTKGISVSRLFKQMRASLK